MYNFIFVILKFANCFVSSSSIYDNVGVRIWPRAALPIAGERIHCEAMHKRHRCDPSPGSGQWLRSGRIRLACATSGARNRCREVCRLCHPSSSRECYRSRRWSDRTCRLRRVCTTSGARNRCTDLCRLCHPSLSRELYQWLDWSVKSPNENVLLWLQAQAQWRRATTQQQNKCMPNDPSSSWNSFLARLELLIISDLKIEIHTAKLVIFNM